MSIRKFEFANGEFYHIFNRGVDKRDIFLDEKNNRKSFAFHIVYQDPSKTLTDSEVNDLHQKIEKALGENIKEAKIR